MLEELVNITQEDFATVSLRTQHATLPNKVFHHVMDDQEIGRDVSKTVLDEGLNSLGKGEITLKTACASKIQNLSAMFLIAVSA